jgi:hypothetical protein
VAGTLPSDPALPPHLGQQSGERDAKNRCWLDHREEKHALFLGYRDGDAIRVIVHVANIVETESGVQIRTQILKI